MDNITNMGADELRMQNLLEAFLVSRKTLKSSAAETSFHIDEDSLTAFAEGNLAEREAVPVVDHLVNCGFCRHKTADLVRLALEFEGSDEELSSAGVAEPHKISEVLSGLLAKIFGTAEGAVFAHSEKDADNKTAQDEDRKEEEK